MLPQSTKHHLKIIYTYLTLLSPPDTTKLFPVPDQLTIAAQHHQTFSTRENHKQHLIIKLSQLARRAI